jgi:hypothetical protein
MRQKEPAVFVVFRATGRERRADGTPALESMSEADLLGLLRTAREKQSAPSFGPALLARSNLLGRTFRTARAAA